MCGAKRNCEGVCVPPDVEAVLPSVSTGHTRLGELWGGEGGSAQIRHCELARRERGEEREGGEEREAA